MSADSESVPPIAKVRHPARLPERVGDQPAVVPLDAANHVRARADDQVGAGVDHRVCERPARASILAEERLVALRDVDCGRALGARVDRDDDEVGVRPRPDGRA